MNIPLNGWRLISRPAFIWRRETIEDAVELSIPLLAIALNENSMPLLPVGVIKQFKAEVWQFTVVAPFTPVIV